MAIFEKWVTYCWVKRIISLLFLVFSGTYLILSVSLPLGSLKLPGPGLVPVAVGIFLSFFSLLHSIEVFLFHKRASEGGVEVFWERKDFLRMMGVLSLLPIYGISLGPLGYILSSIILVVALLRLLGMHGWIRPMLISSMASVVSYCFFKMIFYVSLPLGIFSF